jgi:hypothetical protein
MITQLEDTSPENSPVISIVENPKSEQCNYKSTYPLEELVEEDIRCKSALDSTEEIQFLGNNSPTLSPEGMQHVRGTHP